MGKGIWIGLWGQRTGCEKRTWALEFTWTLCFCWWLRTLILILSFLIYKIGGKSHLKKPWGLNEIICVHLFSVAAVKRNYHKFDGLKQQPLLLSHFWRPAVWNQCPWAEIQVSAGLCFLQQLQRGIRSFLLQLWGYLHSVACGCITPISTSVATFSSHHFLCHLHP